MVKKAVELLTWCIVNYEYALAIIAGSAVFRWVPNNMLKIFGDKLAEPIINISAIGLGFLGAMLAILHTTSHERFEKTKTSDKAIRWLEYISKTSIVLCFLVIFSSCSILVIDLKKINIWERLLLCIWTALVACSIFVVCRLTKAIFKLISFSKSKSNTSM